MKNCCPLALTSVITAEENDETTHAAVLAGIISRNVPESKIILFIPESSNRGFEARNPA